MYRALRRGRGPRLRRANRRRQQFFRIVLLLRDTREAQSARDNVDAWELAVERGLKASLTHGVAVELGLDSNDGDIPFALEDQSNSACGDPSSSMFVVQYITEFGSGGDAEFGVDYDHRNALRENAADGRSHGESLDGRDDNSSHSPIDRFLDQRNLGLGIVVSHGRIPVDIQPDRACDCGGACVLRLPKRGPACSGMTAIVRGVRLQPIAERATRSKAAHQQPGKYAN